ncbi:hypothetical protein ACJRO7_025974 [Eucalyptus globulus]|uniref:Uncharacterized protein n=1 Tax=Eucalyptus globulus TaxID=34317 RepID=A0ABD3KAY1_EUCGL
MAATGWDSRLVPDLKDRTNMECLPFSVIPTVPVKEVPRPRHGEETGESDEKDPVDSFCLGDFWKAYEEWSAYGAGVPIVLPCGESVMQYYFPSLSAIQLFTYQKFPTPLRFSGEGSSMESENDAMSDGSNRSGSSEVLSPGSPGKNLFQDYDFGMQEGSDPEEMPKYHHGELYFQYNEVLNPYARAPLVKKIKELAKKYPGLTTFESTDLTPYSWVAIAWYPIIQIPVMRNQKELSASFLTYHMLSWSTQGLESVIPKDNQRLECIVPPKVESKAMKSGDSKTYNIRVPPFAMSTYKMHGAFWVDPRTLDREMMFSYQRAAWFWLKEHKFQHHDYNFFVSRGA